MSSQDEHDLDRSAGEGMTAAPGEYDLRRGREEMLQARGQRTAGAMALGKSLFAEGIALFKARPLETMGVAFGFGLAVGAGIAAVVRRR